MIASHGDGEITFYEELGVARDASPEEIRDAFRLFVRLLHPDQQTDPQLKEIAENQMRKLNRVYAVLSDPENRRRYDEDLEDARVVPIIVNSPSPGRGRPGATLAWAAAIAVSAGLLIWLASDNSSPVPARTSDPNGTLIAASVPASPGTPPANQESEASQISRLQADLRAVMVERDAAIVEMEKLRRAFQSRPRETQQAPGSRLLDGTEPQPLTLTELPAAAKLPVLASPAPLPRVEQPANRQLAGFWFYAKPPDGQMNKNQALYPPEYIEATVTEEGGVIHGRYRSRFLIVDRAISPEVNFTFSGARNGLQCNCQWTGAGGAKGELILKLTSENSMRVDWSASDLGTQQGLISGTAVLTRRIE
jgi:curved DNA-binding protein CbpA